jgi:hypothetical protein
MASGSTSDTTSVHSRYPRAFAVSFALHLLVVLAVVGLPGPRPALAPVPVVTPSRSVEVFTVAPAEDARFPGLHPLETAQDDWTIKPGDTAAALQIDGFDVDVSKISDRARVLFPFLTPGLSLEVFGLLPRRDVRSRLENPLATRSRQPGGNAPALVLGEDAEADRQVMVPPRTMEGVRTPQQDRPGPYPGRR